MKFQRQARILDLIEKNEIETQEELSEQLCSLGYNATQERCREISRNCD